MINKCNNQFGGTGPADLDSNESTHQEKKEKMMGVSGGKNTPHNCLMLSQEQRSNQAPSRILSLDQPLTRSTSKRLPYTLCSCARTTPSGAVITQWGYERGR